MRYELKGQGEGSRATIWANAETSVEANKLEALAGMFGEIRSQVRITTDSESKVFLAFDETNLKGPSHLVLPGDIMERAERELVSMAGKNLASTVLIAPHHGSGSSSTGLFLDKVNPEYSIISSGWKNRFHFPHPSVLKRYAGLGCKIFRTDINGAITMATGGQSLEIRPYITGSK